MAGSLSKARLRHEPELTGSIFVVFLLLTVDEIRAIGIA